MGEILRQYKKTERDVERKVGRAERKTIGVVRGALSRKRFNRFLRVLGPGLVTGAADDDPSGIATYSQAGAGFGTSLLWAFPLMFPLLLAVQESCARIGAISGKGLAAVIKENYNRRLLYAAVFLVVTANVVNIGADLGAMAATTRLFVDLPFELLAVLFAVLTTLLVVFVSYRSYARFLKWLAITLLAYPLTAFMVGQDWGQVLRDTFVVPSISKEALYVFVGMLGTTISPYLFFWDTSEVVEEEIQKHNVAKIGTDTKATKRFIHNLRVDNFVGMALASVTAWFIVIACASTLNRSGTTNIATAADAARALEPLVQGFPNAGLIAKLIFSVGIIGLGLLAVPVLAGSSSYAISEALGWKEGLYRKFKRASGFYIVIILATLAGLAMNFIGLDPVKALVFSAVFNGIAAIPLLYIIVRVGSNKRVMGNYKNSWLSNLLIRLAFVVMTLAVLVLMASFVV